ncbi:palmitoyltransferase PFA5 [Decorospora gaudefroyi]|uniref:Palmitoyltransferase n=1 Tax=Decorospora gaudefroyi TaxID=184978 RepID=A0A6A5KM63_9PLEO|nr:palmitoyltransferase PFA5 [Decorospora gaudefroyi]
MAPLSVRSAQKPAGLSIAAEQKIGQATSVVIPLAELGAMGYVTWVLVYQICVQYLINPSERMQRDFNVRSQRATGITLIVVYALLLLLLLVAALRLIQMIWSRPDLVPLGDPSSEKMNATFNGFAFDQYDAFICDYQGVPLWCDKCQNWKPDRAHHCKELGRCVRKMDHFCPWAGGIIGESTHKWFMQFVAYTALYTTYVWIVIAIFLADHHSKMDSRPGTWIGALVTAVLFSLFTVTMSGMTGWNLTINYTSVEGIQRGGIHNIAFLISKTTQPPISLPPTPPARNKHGELPDGGWPVLCTTQRNSGKRYVVMQTRPLEHPWYTTPMMGWKDTMGKNVVDWFLPIRQSPCKQKSRRGEFEWAELVYDMARTYEANNPGIRLAILEGVR